jgi:uncharacterized lipoprotein YmbA
MKISKVLPYFILVPALLLSGCIRNDAPMQFYMLNTGAASKAEIKPFTPARETVVGLGPIRIPEYLNRPQMVTAVTENQYRLDDRHRWAERLDQNISRALLQSLSAQLGAVRIVRHPWAERQNIDYQASIDILELHRDADGQSRFTAQWAVKNRDRTLIDRRFDCALPVPQNDYDALVKAQSECLKRLGADIAGTLRQLIVAGGKGEK